MTKITLSQLRRVIKTYKVNKMLGLDVHSLNMVGPYQYAADTFLKFKIEPLHHAQHGAENEALRAC